MSGNLESGRVPSLRRRLLLFISVTSIVLLALAFVTIFGAVAGSHGWMPW